MPTKKDTIQGLRNYRNTSVTVTPDGATVTLYSTEIVRITAGRIELNTGGHATVTTLRRINEVLNTFDTSVGVYQKNFQWYVTTQPGKQGQYLAHGHAQVPSTPPEQVTLWTGDTLTLVWHPAKGETK